MNPAESNPASVSTTASDLAKKLPLKLEDAPAFGGGSMPVEQEKTFVMLAHFFSLIIWLWKRKESPAVDAHGKEALNFGITMMICFVPLGFITGLLGIYFVAKIMSIVFMLAGLAMLALVIFAMLKAREGKLLRYPLNFRLIK